MHTAAMAAVAIRRRRWWHYHRRAVVLLLITAALERQFERQHKVEMSEQVRPVEVDNIAQPHGATKLGGQRGAQREAQACADALRHIRWATSVRRHAGAAAGSVAGPTAAGAGAGAGVGRQVALVRQRREAHHLVAVRGHSTVRAAGGRPVEPRPACRSARRASMGTSAGAGGGGYTVALVTHRTELRAHRRSTAAGARVAAGKVVTRRLGRERGIRSQRQVCDGRQVVQQPPVRRAMTRGVPLVRHAIRLQPRTIEQGLHVFRQATPCCSEGGSL